MPFLPLSMPDWFYRTLAQPWLFRLDDKVGRAVALGMIGNLGRFSAGRALIDLLGHMRPADRLAITVQGQRFASPLGIGWRVDPECRATLALSQFGAGFLVKCASNHLSVAREDDRKGVLLDILEKSASRIRDASTPLSIPVAVYSPGENATLALPGGLTLPVALWSTPPSIAPQFKGGIVLQVGDLLQAGLWRVQSRHPSALLEQVAAWRASLGEAPLVVSDGISGPEDAVALVEAGATLLIVEAGLVYQGPGLIKRCNEALLSRLPTREVRESEPFFRHAFVWVVLLGLALLIGGVAACLLAFTRVLLPYDENYIHLSSVQLQRAMPRLFAFMAHDRATLAGVMIGLGGLYSTVGFNAVRRGVHGAKTAIAASALTGFATFFSFFGFGYFDTLHAFVAAILFQFTVQILIGREGPLNERVLPIDRETRIWRRARWGELFWVIHGIGLIIAGAVILLIGMSAVMVSEDLNFLCTTREAIGAIDPSLFAVIAHDRATLGGMLLASGVAMLLNVLWCFRRGRAWLWNAIFFLGAPAYSAAIGIHFFVGYTDWRHLAPAFAGFILWATGLGLTRNYLCEPNDAANAEVEGSGTDN